MSTRDIYSGSRFRRAIIAFVSGRSIQGLAQFALLILVVRLLDLEQYGAYMAVWGLIDLALPLSSFGLLEATRRYLPELAAKGNAGSVRRFISGATLARASILLLFALVYYFSWANICEFIGLNASQQDAAKYAIPLMVTVLVFRYIAEILQSLLESTRALLPGIVFALGRIAGIAFLIASDSVSLQNLFLMEVGVSILALILSLLLLSSCLKQMDFKGDHSIPLAELGQFAWHMFGVSVLQAAANPGSIRILAAHLLGLEVAGAFAFIQNLTQIIGRYIPAQFLVSTIRPMLVAKSAAGRKNLVISSLSLMIKSNLLAVILVSVVAVVAGSEIVQLASGDKFPGQGIILLLLIVKLGITSFERVINMAMQLFNHAGNLRNLSILYLLVPIFAFMAGDFGIIGFALALILASGTKFACTYFWLERREHLSVLDTAALARAFSAALIALLFGLVIAGIGGATIALVASVTAVLLGWWALKPLSAVDKKVLEDTLRMQLPFLDSYVYRGKPTGPDQPNTSE